MQARANIIEESFERVQDRFRNAGEELQKLAHVKSQEIQRAYRQLHG